MKRYLMLVILILVIFCGCSAENTQMDQAMQLRTNLLHGSGCEFDTIITADYGDKVYTFTLSCSADAEGNLQFKVLEPQYIAGIDGKIESNSGKLIYNDLVLGFELQADGLLSPVSAPWIFLRALRSGYVRYCGVDGKYILLTVDDSYQTDALMLDIWINDDLQPIQADVYENNRCILSIQIQNFRIL